MVKAFRTLKELRAGASIRNKRYYENHKDEILAQQKIYRKQKKINAKKEIK